MHGHGASIEERNLRRGRGIHRHVAADVVAVAGDKAAKLAPYSAITNLRVSAFPFAFTR